MKKNLIITGANTAREIGTPRPVATDYKERAPFRLYKQALVTWMEEEGKLKEYRITNSIRNYGDSFDFVVNNGLIAFEKGTEVECEVNEETLEAIIL